MTDTLCALQQEVERVSRQHGELELFLRSPRAQLVGMSELAMMRHQLRALDEYLYWTRQRVRAIGGNA